MDPYKISLVSSEVAKLAPITSGTGQFLETQMILRLKFTCPHAITYTKINDSFVGDWMVVSTPYRYFRPTCFCQQNIIIRKHKQRVLSRYWYIVPRSYGKQCGYSIEKPWHSNIADFCHLIIIPLLPANLSSVLQQQTFDYLCWGTLYV